MTAPDLAATAEHPFVALTTFRRDGTPVVTPVWVARSGDALVVITAARTGKVRRVRRDPRVELRPCSRRGAVAADAPVLVGVAEVTDLDESAASALRAKYGWQYRMVSVVERFAARGSRQRVILRITTR